MPDQRPVYLNMRGTNRLSRQAELILRIIPIDGTDELKEQDLKLPARLFQTGEGLVATITTDKRKGGLKMPMKQPRGVMPTHWRNTLKDYAPLGRRENVGRNGGQFDFHKDLWCAIIALAINPPSRGQRF